MFRSKRSLFPELEKDLRAFTDVTTGILPSQEIEALVESRAIASSVPISPDQIQPASLDLRLGAVAHRVRASFLPRKASSVSRKIEHLRMHDIDITRPAVLTCDAPRHQNACAPSSVTPNEYVSWLCRW